MNPALPAIAAMGRFNVKYAVPRSLPAGDVPGIADLRKGGKSARRDNQHVTTSDRCDGGRLLPDKGEPGV